MKAFVNKEKCKACGLCIVNCPKQAIAMTNELNNHGYKHVVVAEETCIGCGICYIVCPDGVFTVAEKEEA